MVFCAATYVSTESCLSRVPPHFHMILQDCSIHEHQTNFGGFKAVSFRNMVKEDPAVRLRAIYFCPINRGDRWMMVRAFVPPQSILSARRDSKKKTY